MKPFKTLLIGFIIGGLFAGAVVFAWMKGLLEESSKQQQLELKEQTGMIEASRNSGLVRMLANVLDLIDNELQDNPKRMLSDVTIARVAALAYAFKPYTHPEDDSLSARMLSPEKGELLLALSALKLDSGSLHKIFYSTSFAFADLRDADLGGADLQGIDLSGAYLRGANLKGANLTAANLSFADVWSANMSNASLMDANLKRAEVSWADLNGADLRGADVTEANLISSQLRKADLRGSILRLTDFTGAFLNEARLDSTDMFRTTLRRANLEGASLTKADMNLANAVEANLTKVNLAGTNLSDVVVAEGNWLKLLNDWQVSGAEVIGDSYKVVDELSTGRHLYQLKVKSEK